MAAESKRKGRVQKKIAGPRAEACDPRVCDENRRLLIKYDEERRALLIENQQLKSEVRRYDEKPCGWCEMLLRELADWRRTA